MRLRGPLGVLGVLLFSLFLYAIPVPMKEDELGKNAAAALHKG